MDIAVLGMGRMGSALATRLLHGGHRVTVWNRTKGKAGEAVSEGAREARSVAEAVRDADVVITMLANDDAVRAIAYGDLGSSIGDQTVYVNCSTVPPALNTELAGAFPARFVAMPVLGSPDAVRAGQAVYLPGGDGSVVDRLTPALCSLSTTIHRYDTASLTGPQDGWWTTVLGAKDAGIAINIARGCNIELPEAEVVKRLYDETAASGLGHADVAAVTELYRRPAASEAAAAT